MQCRDPRRKVIGNRRNCQTNAVELVELPVTDGPMVGVQFVKMPLERGDLLLQGAQICRQRIEGYCCVRPT